MSKDEKRFYVYAYLRSQNSEHGRKGSPYYIGKGTGQRAWSRVRKIHRPKDKSRIVFLRSDLTEAEAFDWEIFYIAKYGRIDKGTGILRNLTDGGEGASGMIVSEERRVQMAKVAGEARRREGRWRGDKNPKAGGDPVRGEKNPMWGKKHKESTLQLISEANKEFYSKPENRLQNKFKAQKYLYELIDPDGEVYMAENLWEFSKQYDLVNSCLNKVIHGKAAHHKGWTGKIAETLR
jgi:hypothetical protein